MASRATRQDDGERHRERVDIEAAPSLPLTKYFAMLHQAGSWSVSFGRMHMKKAVLVGMCALAYAAWPYIALYRIGQALKQADVPALTADVAWPSVREGLCDDIVQTMTGEGTAVQAAADELPPFGSGFVTAMTTDMVDRLVTPGQLSESLRDDHASLMQPGRAVLRSAWFTSPTSFEVSFWLKSDSFASSPIRVRLDLIKGNWVPQWRITRAWIPTALLQHLAASS